MDIDELLKGIEIIKGRGQPGDINHITDDSREVHSGSLFIAIRGENYDGHTYCREAVRNGAEALIVEEDPKMEVPFYVVPGTRKALALIASNFYGNPSTDMKVIGVTGTNGKTTTVSILGSIYEDSICFNTINYRVSEGEIDSINTTPSPLFLHRELRKALDNGFNTAIIEVSSHGIKQERIAGIKFDYGIFTNISRDHLDYHGTFENYLEVKTRFFRNLGEESMAILNADDSNSSYIMRDIESKLITYGFKKGNIIGRVLENNLSNLNLVIEGLGKTIEVKSKLIGIHNGYNILGSVALAIIDGVEVSRIKEGIIKVTPPSGRFEIVDIPAPFTVLIDYAHTPEALNSALSSLKDIEHSRIITVFGAGGDRDRGKRAIMGMVVSELSDITVVTTDNPRSEEPEEIIDDIYRGIEKKKDIYRIADRKEAIRRAINLAESDDIVLIAGKGHENYQEIRSERIEFSDKECVKELYSNAEVNRK